MWFNEYKSIVTNDGEKKLTPIMGLFGGMSAGCFSTLGNNPFDVVKVCRNLDVIVDQIMLFVHKTRKLTHSIIFVSLKSQNVLFEKRLVCKELKHHNMQTPWIASNKL